ARVPLEGDDLVGVRPGGRERRRAEAADELVERVEGGGAGELGESGAGTEDVLHAPNLRRGFLAAGAGNRTFAVRRAGVLRYRRTAARTKSRRFAGRSASRRMRYGYHSGPYGVATSTLYPRPTSWSCSCGRTP